MIPVHSTDPFYDYTKWQSYLPALMACAAVTTGPVLEVGIGHYSTPLLHAYCIAAKRPLMSVENDPEWFNRFAPHLGSQDHKFYFGDYDVVVPRVSKAITQTGLLSFIDNHHSTIPQSRMRNFNWLLPVSDFVVLHDYSDETQSLIEPLLKDGVKHVVTSAYTPPTLVATARQDLEIPRSILDLK